MSQQSHCRAGRVWTIACALGWLLSACPKHASEPNEPARAPAIETPPSAQARPEPAVNDPSDTPASHVEHVEIEVARVKMLITVEDGSAIKAALLDWLQQSDLGDKTELIGITQTAQVSIAQDAVLRIGRWNLHADQDRLVLTLRGPTGPAGAIGFSASIAKEAGAWRVHDVVPVHIHARR
jgi:hypothetical protein